MAAQDSNHRYIYIGVFVHTPSPQTLSVNLQGAIGVSAVGIIDFIDLECAPDTSIETIAARHDWEQGSYKVIRTPTGRSAFFFPGFIDTHTHASQYPNTGIFGTSTLLDWLETYTFPLESSFSSLERAKLVYNRVVQRLISNGTTCAAYYATVHVPATNLLAEICKDRGQRALIGRVCMNRMSPEHYRDESEAAGIDLTKQTIQHIRTIDPNGTFIRPVITPRFAPSCTKAYLRRLGDLQEETGHFAQTHISENKPEIELVKSLFPDSPHYAGVYDATGLLNDKMILAHAVHLTSDEVDLIAERRTKISHCPASNSCLTSGAAKVRKMLDAGIAVGLGTDMSGGFSPSILEMVRQALVVSRHVAMQDGDEAKLSVAEALHLGTLGGASVVGLSGEIGSFEVGKHWDAQMICLDEVGGEALGDRGPVDVFGWEAWEDRIAKWVYAGDDRNTVAVYIKGRLVHSTIPLP